MRGTKLVSLLVAVLVAFSCFEKNPVSSESSGFATPEELAKFYFDCLKTGNQDEAVARCLVSQGEFEELVRDTVETLYDSIIDHGEKHYVIYYLITDSVWARDTVTAADTSSDKYLIGGRRFIVDTLPATETVRYIASYPFGYSSVAFAFDSVFNATAAMVNAKQLSYQSFSSQVGGSAGTVLSSAGTLKSIKATIFGIQGARIQWSDPTGATWYLDMADALVKTTQGWKILFPAAMSGQILSFQPSFEPGYWDTKQVNLTGLWSGPGGMLVQFNAGDSFAFTSYALSGTVEKGTYEIIPTVVFDYSSDPLIIGQFAYRDPNNPRRWMLTPTGQTDTLQMSDSIIYFSMVVSDDPKDSTAAATWPIWALPPTDTVYADTLHQVLSLTFGSNSKVCQFMISMAGYEHTDIDTLSLLARRSWEGANLLPQNPLFPAGALSRLTTTSDPTWKVFAP